MDLAPMKAVDRQVAWDWRLVVPVVMLIIAFDVALGYASTGNPWVVAGLVAALSAIVLLLSSGTALFLTVFVAKPFIDMLWFANVHVSGVSLNAQSIVSVAVLGVGLLTIMIRRIELPNTVFIPMAIFAASNVIALLMTPSLPYGAESFIRVVCGLPLVFVVPTLVKGLPAPRRLLQYYMVAIGVVYVTILLQPLGLLPFGSTDAGGIERATGFYYHPWDVARYLVVALPLVLAIMGDRTTTPALRWMYRGLFAATLLVTFLTYLKAAWIAILVEIILWFFLTRRPLRGVLVLAVVAVVVAFPARDFVFTVFGDLAKLSDPVSSGQALSGRVSVWGTYWASLREASPFQLLFGQGFDPAGYEAIGYTTHDDYLRLAVMNGVLGLLAYLTLIAGALRLLARAVRVLRRRGGIEWRIGVAVQCMVAAYLLMGLTADVSSYSSITLYLWLLIGLVWGYARRDTAREAHVRTESTVASARPTGPAVFDAPG
jgi:hypothetical protein